MSNAGNQGSVVINFFAIVLAVLTLVAGVFAILPPLGIVPTELNMGETTVKTSSSAIIVLVACATFFMALVGFQAAGGIVLHDQGNAVPWYVRHRSLIMVVCGIVIVMGVIAFFVF